MEQKLRHYERLSPELAVLTETPNVNNPITLMTDYLVTGARGWDWLCQLHPGAVILDLENPAACKTAADELVEFPSIVRAFDDGEKLSFVVTELGTEAKEYVDALEAKLKDPNVVVDELPWYPKEDCVQLLKETADINVEDAYPKPGEPMPLRGCTKHAIIVDDAPYINEGKEDVANLNGAPKIDITIKDTDVVAVDMVKEYTPFIRKWAEDRNIIGGGSTALDQFIKGLTEAGELWTHIGKGQCELMKDDIGDVYVCLVNAAGNLDINLEDAVRPLEAYNVHSGRASYKAKGLKRWSLQVLYGMATVAQSIENILDSDNERDAEFFKTDFSEACADVVYALETIALENDWSLSECVIEAYNDIRDRRGLMLSGTFIKESDFTDEMVAAALDDDRVKPETKEYLRQWCVQQLSNQTQEMEAHDKLNALEGGLLGSGAFWQVWNEAQGNKENIAPFAISAEVAHLLSKQKDDQIAVTLGVFGKANHNHEVFLMDLDGIKAALDRLVGKTVGEVENPKPEAGQDITAWLERIVTVDPRNTAGVLVDYVINVLGEGSHGPIIEVVGLVDPSALTKDRVATAGNVHFGIRAIVVVKEKVASANMVTVSQVTNLVCFDLSIENPRQLIK